MLNSVALIAVRVKFDQKINPNDLDTVIKKHGNTLLSLKKKEQINQQNWLLLFPKQGDYNIFVNNHFGDLIKFGILLTNHFILIQY